MLENKISLLTNPVKEKLFLQSDNETALCQHISDSIISLQNDISKIKVEMNSMTLKEENNYQQMIQIKNELEARIINDENNLSYYKSQFQTNFNSSIDNMIKTEVKVNVVHYSGVQIITNTKTFFQFNNGLRILLSDTTQNVRS